MNLQQYTSKVDTCKSMMMAKWLTAMGSNWEGVPLFLFFDQVMHHASSNNYTVPYLPKYKSTPFSRLTVQKRVWVGLEDAH